jgi:hypothetical protein
MSIEITEADSATIEKIARAMCAADGIDPDHDQMRDIPRAPGSSWIGSPAFKKYIKEAQRFLAASKAIARIDA